MPNPTCFIRCLILLVAVAGCGGGPAVLGPHDLPVRRVVLYRNGVAYFERGGTFEGRELRFGVRQPEVGDFLSSLTTIDRAGGRVQSVSFEAPDEPAAPLTPGKRRGRSRRSRPAGRGST
jgi:hypothetical protein